jgi:polyprenyl P-hydroxybenzoate/phenylacrylic acid decarboxylase-like protein
MTQPETPNRRAVTPHSPPQRLVVGISGSSAPHLGLRLLTALRDIRAVDPESIAAHADVVYDPTDLAAAVSSGSFQTMGMVVMPCSMRTLAAVATGNTTDLLTRAADVTLKERRRLVLVTRETPLNLVHIKNMETVTLAGATVLPPVPAFYHRPRTIDDLLDHSVGKVLDQFGIEHDVFRRWP